MVLETGLMVRKRVWDEDILRLLCEIELSLASGADVATACRTAGVRDATYCTWRKRFDGMGRSEMANLKALQKENDRLKSWREKQMIRRMICPEHPWQSLSWTSSS